MGGVRSVVVREGVNNTRLFRGRVPYQVSTPPAKKKVDFFRQKYKILSLRKGEGVKLFCFIGVCSPYTENCYGLLTIGGGAFGDINPLLQKKIKQDKITDY